MSVSASLVQKEECLPETGAMEQRAWALLQLKPETWVLRSVLSSLCREAPPAKVLLPGPSGPPGLSWGTAVRLRVPCTETERSWKLSSGGRVQPCLSFPLPPSPALRHRGCTAPLCVCTETQHFWCVSQWFYSLLGCCNWGTERFVLSEAPRNRVTRLSLLLERASFHVPKETK